MGIEGGFRLPLPQLEWPLVACLGAHWGASFASFLGSEQALSALLHQVTRVRLGWFFLVMCHLLCLLLPKRSLGRQNRRRRSAVVGHETAGSFVASLALVATPRLQPGLDAKPPRRRTPTSCGVQRLASIAAAFVTGCLQLPAVPQPLPFPIMGFAPLILCAPAHAMEHEEGTRPAPEQPLASHSRGAPEESTHVMGDTSGDEALRVGIAGSLEAVLVLPDDAAISESLPSEPWLGAHIFTPYYQITRVAVRAAPSDGLQHVREMLLTAAPNDQESLFDRLVALQPQRHRGYASFLRYSSVLEQQTPPVTPIILDLSRVGGHYFPAVLPQDISARKLFEYIAPHCHEDTDNLQVYIGFSANPHGTDDLQLSPDVVLTVVMVGVAPPPAVDVLDLFAEGAVWDHVRHLPRHTRSPGTCVMTPEHRFYIHESQHYGFGIDEAIANKLRAHLADITIHYMDGPANMDMQGEACSQCALVVRLPRPDEDRPDSLQAQRRDVFTIMDLRQLGIRPCFMHSHFPAWHIPSVLASLDIRIPNGFYLQVLGGCKEDDDVYVPLSAVLTFRVVPNSRPVGLSGEGGDHNPSDDDSDSTDSSDGNPPDPATRPRGPANTRRYANRKRRFRGGPGGSDAGPNQKRPGACTGATCQGPSMAHAQSEAPIVESSIPVFQGVPSLSLWHCLFAAHRYRLTSEVSNLLATAKLHSFEAKTWATAFLGSPTGQFEGAPDALQARGPIQHANTAPPGAQADPDGPDASDVHFPEGGRPALAQRPTPIVHLPREATQVGDAPTHLAFQVLVPDVAPEVVQFEVRLPITAQDALELVTAARDEHYSSRYPDLCPVFPQPDSAFAVLLARPAWAVTVRLACVDARAIDGRLYCMVVPERLRRESLLLWAKVPDSDDLLVAVADQLVPRQGFAHISHGDTIVLFPRGQPRQPVRTLTSMLQAAVGWQVPPEIYTGIPGVHFLVLNDGVPLLHTIAHLHLDDLKRSLLQVLGFRAERTRLQAAHPRITDCLFQGEPLPRRYCGH